MRKIFSFFKKTTFFVFSLFRDPASYRIDRYERLNNFSSIKQITKIINEYASSIRDEKTITSQKIKFNGVEFDCSEKQTIEMLGLPRFKIVESGILKKHKILFYKYNIEPYKFKVQMHFINDRFFFGSYTFDTIQLDEEKRIKSGLIEKYFETTPFIDQNRIVDNSNNLIKIASGSPLVVTYLSGNKSILSSIEQDLQCKKSFEETESLLKESADFLKVKEML